MRRIALALAAVMIAATAVMGGALPAQAEVNPYITEGTHTVNGRQWRTTCEPYSQTKRCRAEIWATQVSQVNGRFVVKNQWAFNNLTYLAAPRSLWEGNKLGYTNRWTAADGRRWYTECDTPATGRNGCRSYAEADVITATQKNGFWTYRWVTQYVFNNIVIFNVPSPPVEALVVMPDHNLKACINQSFNRSSGTDITLKEAAEVGAVDCAQQNVRDLRGLESFTTLQHLQVDGNHVRDLAPIKGLKSLEQLHLLSNAISDVTPLASLTNLDTLDLSDNMVSDLSPLESLTGLSELRLQLNKISDLVPLAKLVNLDYLEIDLNVMITHLGPLAGLKELRALSASSNEIRDISALASLTELESLYLMENRISDLTHVKNLKNLVVLDVNFNTITDVSALSSLTELESLGLGGNTISNIVPLQGLTSLRHLSLSENQVVDVSPIGSLVNLHYLGLDSNRIERVAPLVTLPLLSQLHLWDNPIVDKGSLDPLIARGVDVRFEDPDA